MSFTGDTFTHLFDWEKDPQRQEKIIDARLEAEFGGIATGLSIVYARTREILTAARTYYVRTDGSDSNNGLTDSAGGAFLTIQKAINVISETLDIAGFTVAIQIGGSGVRTFTGAITLKNVRGFAAAGNLVIQGDTTTPSNCAISTTSATCVSASGLNVIWDIKGFKFQTTTGGSCIFADKGSIIRPFNFEMGTSAAHHFICFTGAVIDIRSNYTINGSAAGGFHYHTSYAGLINFVGFTCTVSGTPAFSRFANAQTLGCIECSVSSFSGSATGIRYNSVGNSIIQTNSGGANFFPGNVAGSTGTGGQYV